MSKSASLEQRQAISLQRFQERLEHYLAQRAHLHAQRKQAQTDGILLAEVQAAKVRVESLESVLNEVSDPRALEQVIHQMLAAEKRYDYLLYLTKKAQIHNDMIELR